MKHIFFIIFVLVGVAPLMAQPQLFDYSYVGYKMSEVPVPDAPVKVFVPYKGGDQSGRIQRALDYVASLKVDKKSGLRGAVLLDKGVFSLSKALRISSDGVVLRGMDSKSTVLLKKGYDRGAVVYIEGKDDRHIIDTLSSFDKVKVGDDIIMWRKSSAEWINSLHCSNFGGGKDLGYWGWHPGEIDLEFTRKIIAGADGAKVFDSPLPIKIDNDCVFLRYIWNGRISNSGVENLSMLSEYNKQYPMDEDHAWDGVYIANAKDCWIRKVNFSNFSGSAVVVQRSGSQITVEDCRSLSPISEIGGYRRRTFLTFGEKCLFQRLYSEHGINDFVAGFVAGGPNAFVQCDSHESLGYSGSIGSWASGLLFDDVNIDGNDIKLCNLGLEKYGTGWNSTNSTVYQSTAAGIFADSIPDGSTNYVYGCWAQFSGTGNYDECNNHVKPWSLFASQLQKRLNRDVKNITYTYVRNTEASSSPDFEQAKLMSEQTTTPRVTMKEWIDSIPFTASLCTSDAKVVDDIKQNDVESNHTVSSYAITNGKLTVDGALAVGGKYNSPWWNGRVKYSAMKKLPYGITRFVPEMELHGATDRIDSVVSNFKEKHVLMLSQNYGLWYDRRRDDHERVRRRDGDVWGPFYEQPFARSGQGKALDGLSKYDLNRVNPYYFYRLNEFAKDAASYGMLLFNEHYFQHNILEAGAHWVDCPWRTTNNINATEFPEPVPFTGDKRIFMADYFYDETNEVRRNIHKQYIKNVLDALSDNPNVIHSIGEEFTGPFHFVKFWLQTVDEWKKQTGKKPLIALSVTKDVQDSVLSDSELSKIVDIIDIEQWFYHQNGLYAPAGGVNMAPRQYMRKIKSGNVRFCDVYKAVSEYRGKYPDKPVFYYSKSYPQMAWAVLMAGGSCPDIPVTDNQFLKSVAGMTPVGNTENVYMMRSNLKEALVYVTDDNTKISKNLLCGKYHTFSVDKVTGEIIKLKDIKINSDEPIVLNGGIYWFRPSL